MRILRKSTVKPPPKLRSGLVRTAGDIISEKELQGSIMEEAKLRGWWVYHTYDSRMSQAGLPDLILCRPPVLLFLEIKSKGGKASIVQQTVIDMLRRCTVVKSMIVYPPNRDEIGELLR